METEIDEGRGQAVGSRIRLSGRVLGVALSVEEVVVERHPPRRKVWATTGTPKLLVIGHYRMGFELSPQGSRSLLRVFIEYALPERGLGVCAAEAAQPPSRRLSSRLPRAPSARELQRV